MTNEAEPKRELARYEREVEIAVQELAKRFPGRLTPDELTTLKLSSLVILDVLWDLGWELRSYLVDEPYRDQIRAVDGVIDAIIPGEQK